MLLPDLIPVARRLGVVVVQNPSHFMVGSRFFSPAYGPEFARWFQPAKSLLANGIPLALGSDGPVNPFFNLMLAVNHPNPQPTRPQPTPQPTPPPDTEPPIRA